MTIPPFSDSPPCYGGGGGPLADQNQIEWDLRVALFRRDDSARDRALHAWEAAWGGVPEDLEAWSQEARRALALLDEGRQAAKRGDPAAMAVLDEVRTLSPFYVDEVKRKLEEELAWASRPRVQGARTSRVVVGAPDHRLWTLGPSPIWRVAIDESGDFSPRGLFAAVCVPDEVEMPDRRPFHAATEAPEVRDEVLQVILDRPVGVVVVDIADHLEGEVARWERGLVATFDWILALLPRQGPVDLRVHVEQRSHFYAGLNLELAMAQRLDDLAEADPSWVGSRCTVVVVDKDDRLGPFADALAHTAGGSSADTQDRRRRSGLFPGCAISGALVAQARSWRRWTGGQPPSPALWRELVSEPPAARPPVSPMRTPEEPLDLLARSLGALGAVAQGDPRLWRSYLGATREHLDGKAVSVERLGAELAWLERYAPPGEALRPAERLRWRTSALEEANHRGDVVFGHEAELVGLSARLAGEDCWGSVDADLRLAVLDTNRFDWGGASARLHPWIRVGRPALGHQRWGRLHSSLAQHAAARGDWSRAHGHFDQALEAFGALSDPDLAASEARQTATYRVLALIADSRAPAETVRKALAGLIGPLPQSLGPLAASVADGERFAHHLAVQFVVERGDAAEGAAWRGSVGLHHEGAGHPWPLILAWRAALVEREDPELALALLGQADESAALLEGGPVLLLQRCAFGVAAEGLGKRWPGLDLDLGAVARALPRALPWVEALGKRRGARVTPGSVVREALVAGLPPLFR